MGQDFASFWFGGSLSPHSRLCIQSFLDHGYHFALYSYDPALEVPEGCILKDASEIYDRDRVFFYQGDGEKVSAFSNMFRYRMIYETGTCWVDTDVLCTGDAFPTDQFVFARQDDEFINGAVLRFPAGHEAMQLAAEYCWEVRDRANWGDLGPRLLTRVIEEYDLEGAACPTEAIYPIHWREAMWVLDPTLKATVDARVSRAATVHLWNEIFTRNGVDKRALPADGCYLREVVERHRASAFFAPCHANAAV